MLVIDVFAVIFLVICTVLGIRSNFMSEIIKIIVLLAVFMIVYFVHPILIDQLERFLKIGQGLYWATFLAFFLALAFFASIFTMFVLNAFCTFENKKVISYVISGFAGTARGLIYLGAIMWLVTAVAPHSGVADIIQKGKVTSFSRYAMMETYSFLDNFIRKNGITPSILEHKLFDDTEEPVTDEANEKLDGIKRDLESLEREMGDALNGLQ